MSPSTATTQPTTATPNTWENLWRGSGIPAVALFVAGYFVYGTQPGIGSPAETVAAFYVSHQTRILWAAVFFGLGGVLNLMWFAAAIRGVLREAGQAGWGSAATASSAAVGGVFLVLISICAALANSIAGSGNAALVSGLNDLVWAGIVMSAFPRAMLIMSSSFGLWRAGIMSSGLFQACIGLVVLGVAGGTTWMSGGFWAPDGLYSRLILPILSLVWIIVVSGVLKRAPATRDEW
jgi:hypothetical protein